VRQAEQGPLHPIYGGGLVLLCPNRTPHQLTTRRQKVAVTNMLGNSAMTGNLQGRARPGNGLVRRSRKRREPRWSSGTPLIKCMREARGAPSRRLCRGAITARRPRVPQRGLREIKMVTRWALSYPTPSVAWPQCGAPVPVKRLRRSCRNAARGMQRDTGATRDATGHPALSDPADDGPAQRADRSLMCRDFLGFWVPG
jgi:hypothetical protein